MNIGNIFSSLVPITNFNRGQASKIFDRLKTEKRLIVLKNNAPSAVILSPEEYERIVEIEENYNLLTLAQNRIEKTGLDKAITEAELMERLGITEDDIQNAEDLEIE